MFKIYPRGFVGIEPIKKTKDEKDKGKDEIDLIGATFRIKSKKKEEESEYDHDISNMFSKARERGSFSNFDFREKLLIKARDVFTFNGENRSFKKFLIYQVEYGELSLNHVYCLKDILDFIIKGKNGLKLYTWLEMLSDENNLRLSQRDKEDIKKGFKKLEYPELTSVTSVICMWTSRPGGYENLLRSLWILYGEEHLFKKGVFG